MADVWISTIQTLAADVQTGIANDYVRLYATQNLSSNIWKAKFEMEKKLSTALNGKFSNEEFLRCVTKGMDPTSILICLPAAWAVNMGDHFENICAS